MLTHIFEINEKVLLKTFAPKTLQRLQWLENSVHARTDKQQKRAKDRERDSDGMDDVELKKNTANVMKLTFIFSQQKQVPNVRLEGCTIEQTIKKKDTHTHTAPFNDQQLKRIVRRLKANSTRHC